LGYNIKPDGVILMLSIPDLGCCYQRAKIARRLHCALQLAVNMDKAMQDGARCRGH
jgi:hypothetical protein